MSGPLAGYQFKFLDFKGLSGQSDEWIAFDRTTLIVGRNNVGKSAVVHALRFAVDPNESFNPEWHRHGKNARIHLRQALQEPELRRVFHESTSGGPISGNHWAFGKNLIGAIVQQELDSQRRQKWVVQPSLTGVSANGQNQILAELLKAVPVPKISVFGISAERDVIPESAGGPQPVKPGGEGLTNLVRAFLYDSSLPMDEVEVGLLQDLNWVFEQDAAFERILCRQDQSGQWEIFLVSKGGGAVRLSQSGSSLKSIFIMLAALRLNPIIDRKTDISTAIFFVEEPENNLHPALLRRLLEYLDSAARDRDCNLIVTTHSPPAIDWASRREGTSLFHVVRGSDGAIITAVKEYGATRRLLDDLDVRASEILQANGVIWVEGPTERIYLRRWIDLLTDGELVEGQHYTIMFYGGRLLSHLSVAAPSGRGDFIHLLRMNRNLALIMDSDRRKLPSGRFRSQINDTKKRVLEEAKSAGGLIWITEGREIENYLSDRLTKKIAANRRAPGKFESVAEALKISDKVKLAELAVDVMEVADLDTLDLNTRLSLLCNEIRRWNKPA